MTSVQPCPRCGKRLPSGVRFCRRCGLALTPRSAGAAVPPVTVPPLAQAPGTWGEPLTASEPLPPQPGAPSADRRRPPARQPVGFWAPAFMAVLFCVAVAAVFFVCFSGALDDGRQSGEPASRAPETMSPDPSYSPQMPGNPGPMHSAPPYSPGTGWGSGPVAPTWPPAVPAAPAPSIPPQPVPLPHGVRPAYPSYNGRRPWPATPSPYDPYQSDGRPDPQNGRRSPNDW